MSPTLRPVLKFWRRFQRLSLVLSSMAFCGLARADFSAELRAEADAIVARIRQPTIPDRVYNVRDFGAIPNDDGDDLPALRKAIAAASAAGGGRVVLPAGTWFTKGPINLVSHIELHLEAKAILRFSSEPTDYLPLVLTRWEGTECFNYSPLIFTRYASDVAITGRGTLDFNAGKTFATWKPKQIPGRDRLRAWSNDGTPVIQRVMGEGQWMRPSTIQFWGCTRVLVEGVRIIDAPFWVVHPVYSREVTVRGITVDSRNLNNDGCDPDSSSDVLIEHCTFRTGDDSVAIKSGRDADGRSIGVPSENIVVRNCTLDSTANGLCIGSEMSGGVRNVFLLDCEIGDVKSALFFKGNLDRGGEVSHVRVAGIKVRRATRSFIDFTTRYAGYLGGKFPPLFRDFVLTDVQCVESGVPAIQFIGDPGAPIEGITLNNVHVARTENPLELSGVSSITFENVTVNGRAIVSPK